MVPVDLTAGAAPAMRVVSGAAQQPATVPGCGLVVINPGQTGYYRTLHAPGHFNQLASGFTTLGLSDQLGLLGDSLGLANGGYAPLDRYLSLVDRVPAGADPLVWDLAAGQLAGLDALLDGDPAQPAFRARARALLAPQFARVGFRSAVGEAPSVSILRETLIQALGGMGDPEMVAGIRKLAAGGLDKVPGAIREPVTAAYIQNASPEEWEKLRRAAAAEKDPGVKRSLYSQLGLARDPALARAALAMALTEEATVPNRTMLIRGVATAHPALAFDWAVANADKVNALVESSSRPRYIVGLAQRATDPAVADRVRAYAERALPAESRQGADTAISQIRYRAGLKASQRGALVAWSNRPR
jgi:aminopeptidase N